ncbi:hypothetical protein SeMB42_g01422 [Synchytrium endobioticum]|uniref:Pinin/SDK/MemA protein domain-containing protein n=1 Tax=Synchytrium endobioticum TaxID=286115 RepID=A0A507DLY1_9FUNG|nr:hypothetical protein SeMB42_g01422 [Synchytrium endobioticum]
MAAVEADIPSNKSTLSDDDAKSTKRRRADHENEDVIEIEINIDEDANRATRGARPEIITTNRGEDLRVVGAASAASSKEEGLHSSEWNHSAKKDDDANASVTKRARLASSGDVESRKRGQRMFGSILGTLNKAKQETQHKSASQLKREELEKKLQEKLAKEKDELEAKVKQDNEERKEKFLAARKADDEKRFAVAIQHLRSHKQHLSNWLKTTAHPSIYYLPAKLSEETQQKLADAKRQAVVDTMKLNSSASAEQKPDVPEVSEHTGSANSTERLSPSRNEGDSANATEEIVNSDAAMMQQELGGDAPIAEDEQVMELGM